MFDLGFGEMMVIAVLVIVFIGPDGLPDLMRVLGRFYAQARRASDELRRTFNAEVARVEADRRREELKARREAREAQRPPDDLLPPDPRLPPDAAPRRARRPAEVTEAPAEGDKAAQEAPPEVAPSPPPEVPS